MPRLLLYANNFVNQSILWGYPSLGRSTLLGMMSICVCLCHVLHSWYDPIPYIDVRSDKVHTASKDLEMFTPFHP